jgi:hypothetical protein
MFLISTAITGTKIIVAIVVLVVIAGGVFFWLRSRNAASQS